MASNNPLSHHAEYLLYFYFSVMLHNFSFNLCEGNILKISVCIKRSNFMWSFYFLFSSSGEKVLLSFGKLEGASQEQRESEMT